MTARQIIQQIEALPTTEQRDIFDSLQKRFKADVASPHAAVQYLDPKAAEPLIKEILAEHAPLFRKLAQ